MLHIKVISDADDYYVTGLERATNPNRSITPELQSQVGKLLEG